MHTQNFSLGVWGWGTDPEAMYNLCMILKIMLWNSCKNLWANILLGYKEN